MSTDVALFVLTIALLLGLFYAGVLAGWYLGEHQNENDRATHADQVKDLISKIQQLEFRIAMAKEDE